ncbi:MAG: L-2-hydroxyglutarate oxidase [Myxococcota bacterium]|jgi:L-2-hydroxyglutarate oxidase
MSPDLLIIGGGVVGLTVALAARRRWADARVTVLEKEPMCGLHASGRNSGVLHAGFYYTADSLKARFSRDGRAAWVTWCAARGLPVRACGKLVVARAPADLPQLDLLLARAAANGVRLEQVSEAEARAIEPRVRTQARALWCPDTAAVDPSAVVAELVREADRAGITVRTGVAWRGWDGRTLTTDGPIDAGVVVNCAGMYADRIAHAHGLAHDLRLLPFKGLYLYGDTEAQPLACHVYPVPDLDMPFLGVHWTVTPDGRSKIGPTALPALWREHYGGLAGFDARELADVVGRQARLFAGSVSFRRLAVHELLKSRRAALIREASRLLDGVDPARFRTWGRPGIRAQLVDTRTNALVMDFVLRSDERSLHVLNAVSPAFTCALPFAEHVVEQLPWST